MIEFLLGLVAWILLGAAILAYVDRDGTLLEWLTETRNPFFRWLALILWPLMVWNYYR